MSKVDEVIVRTPGVLGGRAHVSGTPICVKDVVAWCDFNLESLLDDRILKALAQLDGKQVRAALQYYWNHRSEIEEDFEAELKLLVELQKGRTVREFLLNPNPPKEGVGLAS